MSSCSHPLLPPLRFKNRTRKLGRSLCLARPILIDHLAKQWTCQKLCTRPSTLRSRLPPTATSPADSSRSSWTLASRFPKPLISNPSSTMTRLLITHVTLNSSKPCTVRSSVVLQMTSVFYMTSGKLISPPSSTHQPFLTSPASASKLTRIPFLRTSWRFPAHRSHMELQVWTQ